ncbi:MAG TPA: hypothetical protein DEP87_03680 [Candidatus Pacebacteria bacterium]|nr:hypothetical protein [Candidatus Paceibacterota bacterium]
MSHHLKKTSPVDFKLSKAEQIFEQALETGIYAEEPVSQKTGSMLREAATEYLTLNASKPITIRINQLDLIKVKVKAKKHQIPYQTLLGSLIHQYADRIENGAL